MCIIERYNLVHPNGAPERKDHLLYCPFGSPVNPCNNTRIEYLPDAFVQWPEPALGPPYQAERIEPGEAPRPFRKEETRRSKKVHDGLKLVWDFHIPFTSRKSKKNKKKNKPQTPRNVFMRRREGQPRHENQNPMPPEFHVGPPGYGPPLQGWPEIVQIPHGPQQHAPRAAEPQIIRPRRNNPLNVQIHQAGDSSSPSPPTHLRQHRRQHTRTPSETRRYEELKREVRERERRAHVDRQRRDQAERAAQATQHEIERLRRENLLQRENLELLREQGRRREREETRQMEEQGARRQRRIRLDEQWWQHQEDIEIGQARRRQEQEDRQALQEAAAREQIRRDQIRRDQDERDRIERQRRAGIPRGPRHRPEVHQRRRVSFDERGDQVIDEAIQDRRRFENRAPVPPRRGWSRHRDVGGGVRRRDTIAVTERGVYEDDRRRGGRRHI
ncbi:MAG: hypothetical protein Q9195_002202 [Heterodermia aff. obscurata]